MGGSIARSLEAFDWWLDQPAEKRTSPEIAKQFSVSISTAEKWRAKFGKMLTAQLQKQIGGKLKEYVEEYQQVQKSATETALTLSSVYQAKANELKLVADSGGDVDTDELNKITSGMKSVYSLAESASGADVAKSKAKQADASGGASVPALPYFPEADFTVESEAIEETGHPENSSANESPSENPA